MKPLCPPVLMLLVGCTSAPIAKVQLDLNPAHAPLMTVQRFAQPETVIQPPPLPSAATIRFLPVSINLMWHEDDANAASFNVYYGTDSRAYLNSVNVGANLSATISGLAPLQTYYFAVTAVDAFGVESDFSNELVATPQPQLIRLHFPEANIVGIQSSTDLVNWIDCPDATETNGDWFVRF